MLRHRPEDVQLRHGDLFHAQPHGEPPSAQADARPEHQDRLQQATLFRSGPIPNPQSPIPNPQSPIPIFLLKNKNDNIIILFK